MMKRISHSNCPIPTSEESTNVFLSKIYHSTIGGRCWWWTQARASDASDRKRRKRETSRRRQAMHGRRSQASQEEETGGGRSQQEKRSRIEKRYDTHYWKKKKADNCLQFTENGYDYHDISLKSLKP